MVKFRSVMKATTLVRLGFGTVVSHTRGRTTSILLQGVFGVAAWPSRGGVIGIATSRYRKYDG
jgi:hypothetical protein